MTKDEIARNLMRMGYTKVFVVTDADGQARQIGIQRPGEYRYSHHDVPRPNPTTWEDFLVRVMLPKARAT